MLRGYLDSPEGQAEEAGFEDLLQPFCFDDGQLEMASKQAFPLSSLRDAHNESGRLRRALE